MSVDTRSLTVRLITYTDNYYGISQRDIELARQISAAVRKLGLPADPSAVQGVLVIPARALPPRCCRSGGPCSGMSIAAATPARTSSIHAVGAGVLVRANG
jgi:4a-hydroxytetrahydrobiopterin dehydratase